MSGVLNVDKMLLSAYTARIRIIATEALMEQVSLGDVQKHGSMLRQQVRVTYQEIVSCTTMYEKIVGKPFEQRRNDLKNPTLYKSIEETEKKAMSEFIDGQRRIQGVSGTTASAAINVPSMQEKLAFMTGRLVESLKTLQTLGKNSDTVATEELLGWSMSLRASVWYPSWRFLAAAPALADELAMTPELRNDKKRKKKNAPPVKALKKNASVLGHQQQDDSDNEDDEGEGLGIATAVFRKELAPLAWRTYIVQNNLRFAGNPSYVVSTTLIPIWSEALEVLMNRYALRRRRRRRHHRHRSSTRGLDDDDSGWNRHQWMMGVHDQDTVDSSQQQQRVKIPRTVVGDRKNSVWAVKDEATLPPILRRHDAAADKNIHDDDDWRKSEGDDVLEEESLLLNKKKKKRKKLTTPSTTTQNTNENTPHPSHHSSLRVFPGSDLQQLRELLVRRREEDEKRRRLGKKDERHTSARQEWKSSAERDIYLRNVTDIIMKRKRIELLMKRVLPKLQLRVYWDAYCCGCCGFSSEIVHLVYPLSRRRIVHLMLGEKCFCSGYPDAVRDSLKRSFLTRDGYLLQGMRSGVSNKNILLSKQQQQPPVPDGNQRRDDASSSSSSSSALSWTLDSDEEVMLGSDVRVWVSHTDPSRYRPQLMDKRKPDYVIGRSMYEFSRIGENWAVPASTTVDEIWVPGEFVRNVFNASGVPSERMRIIPEAIDTKQFRPSLVTDVDSLSRTKNRGRRRRRRVVVRGTVQNDSHNDDDDDAVVINHDNGQLHGDDDERKEFQLPLRGWYKKHWRHWCNKEAIEEEDNDDDDDDESRRSSTSYKFFSNFKWEPRKGWDVLMEAYYRAFATPITTTTTTTTTTTPIFDKTPPGHDSDHNFTTISNVPLFIHSDKKNYQPSHEKDNNKKKGQEEDSKKKRREKRRTPRVSLYLLTFMFFNGGDDNLDTHNSTWMQQELHDFAIRKGLPGYKTLSDFPHFCFITEQISEAELVDLYNSADAFVLPTRGEGWGLPIMEAMSVGLPTIATNWGGNTEYMTQENSFLLPVDGVEEVPRNSMYGYQRGKKWAIPSMLHLMKIMLHVVKNPEKAREVGMKGRRDVVQYFDEMPVTDILDERLEEIKRIVLERRLLASWDSNLQKHK